MADPQLPIVSVDEANNGGYSATPPPAVSAPQPISADDANSGDYTAAPPAPAPQAISADEANKGDYSATPPPAAPAPQAISADEANSGAYSALPPAQGETETALRRGLHEAPAAFGSIPAMVAGAAQGTEWGLAAAPFLGPLAPAAPIVGGIAGGFAAGGIAGYVLQKASNLIQTALGVDESAQLEANKEANPTSDVVGGVLPWLATGRPSMQLALKTRLPMAAAGAGFSALQQEAQTGHIDPTEVAANAAVMGLTDKPWGIGKPLAALGERFSVPPRAAIGVSESPPPPSQTADVGNDTSPPIRDQGNKGTYAKKPEPTEGSKSMATLDPATGLDEATLGVLDKSLEASALKPPSGDKPSITTQRKPGVDMEAAARAAEQMPAPAAEPPPAGQSPISDRLPTLDAQHAQDIAATTDAKAQAEALQNIKAKQAGHDQPLTPAEEAAPERAAAPATNPNLRTVQWTDPHLQGLRVETADLGDKLSQMSPDGKTLQLSAKVPESIQVGDKTLNPAEPLAVRERATQLGTEKGLSLDDATNKVGIPSENDWLKQKGYDPAAYQKTMDGLRTGETAPPAAQAAIEAGPTKAALRVQARQEAEARAAADTIPLQTKPTSVQPANRVRPVVDMGMGEPAAQEAPAKVVPGKDAAQKLLDARTDLPQDTRQRMQDVIESDNIPGIRAVLTQMRNKANRTTLEGSGVQVAPEDAAAKQRAIDVSTAAINAFPDKSNRPATTPSEIAALRVRVQNMLDHATAANGGTSPLDAYKAREKPAAWELLREAHNMLQTKTTTPEQALEFSTNETLARGALKDDPNATNTLGTRRIESDISFKGNPEEAVPQETLTEARERSEAEVEKNLTADMQDLGKTHDLSTAAGRDQIQTDTEKVVPNLIAAIDKKAAAARWDRSAEELAEKNPRVREAASLVKRGSPDAPLPEPQSGTGRSIPLTDDVIKAALASADKVKARTDKAAYRPNAETIDSPDALRLKDLPSKFLGDEAGSLNTDRIHADLKTKADMFRRLSSEWFGATWNDPQRIAKSIMTKMLTHGDVMKTDGREMFDATWHEIDKTSTPKEFFGFLDAMEKTAAYTEPLSGVGPRPINKAELLDQLGKSGVAPDRAPLLADMAPLFREPLDQMFREDLKYGSTAEYIKTYVPHFFGNTKVNGMSVEKWILARNAARTPTVGSTTFQQERVFDTVQAALAHGFKLRYESIADLLGARYAASVDFHMLIGSLRKLEEYGLAVPEMDASGAQKNWPNTDGKQYIAPDHNTWFIHADGVPSFENAVANTGLRNAPNVGGSMYRFWLKAKAVWVPIELIFTAFHPVHVLGINLAENLTGAMHEGFNSPGEAYTQIKTALKNSATQPFLMLPLDKMPLGLGEKYAQTKMGTAQEAAKNSQMVQWWKKPEADRTPAEKRWQALAESAGMLREQPPAERIIADRVLPNAWDRGEYPTAALALGRVALQKASAGMFTNWIPDLKMAAFQNAAARALRMDPDLLSDSRRRDSVMRMIGSNIHSRYGEMNYKSMLWKPIARDVGVGSFLSLSWQLGMVNQLAGAARNLIMRAGGKTMEQAGTYLHDATLEAAGKERQGTSLQQTLYKHSNSGTYVMTYVATSLLFGGALSYMLSGKPPKGLDYSYPQNGNTNPDGSPGRYTLPFNTREGPMLQSHVTESDSVVKGFSQLLYNKLIIQPIVEAFQNKDSLGNEMYSVHASPFMTALQLADSELGRHFSPISITNANRSKQLGGGTKDTIAAYLGAAPAPAYVNRPGLDGQIMNLYREHSAPSERPYEISGTGLVKSIFGGKNIAQQRQDARNAKFQAIQSGDKVAEQKANEALRSTGEGNNAIRNQRPGSDIPFFFSQLPITDQAILTKQLAQDTKDGRAQFNRLVITNRGIHGKVKRQLREEFDKESVNQ